MAIATDDMAPYYYAPTSRTMSVSSQDNEDATNPIALQNVKLEAGAESDAQWKPGRQQWAIMLTLFLCSLVVALDTDILIAALPTIAARLNGSTTEAFWAGTGYLLPYAVAQPLMANLSDFFGRRAILLASLILFIIGSIPCAAAQDMPTLLAGRVIQGLGGAGIVALTQAIYTDIIPLRFRPKYFGVVLMAWAIGTTAGPVVGGALADAGGLGWRWCFIINFFICVPALFPTYYFVKLKTRQDGRTLGQKLRTVDYLGNILLLGGMTSLLVALSWGGSQYSWSSPATLAPLILGVLSLLSFAIWERFGTRHAMITKSVFPSLSSKILFALSFLYGMLLFMALYYLCLYFSAVRIYSPTQAGTNMVPALILAVPSSIIVGILITKFGHLRWAIWLGHSIEVIGFGLMIRLDATTPRWYWALAVSLAGLGSGITLQSLTTGTQAAARTDRDSAAATVMYTFLRSTGMCVGVSVGSTIFQNVARTALEDRGLPGAIARNVEGYVVEILHDLPAQDPLRVAATDSFVEGIRAIFIAMTAIKAAALLASFAVKRQNLDRKLDGAYQVEGRTGGASASRV
jgi:EmrB/QacA subfamily drug resistance transporter